MPPTRGSGQSIRACYLIHTILMPEVSRRIDATPSSARRESPEAFTGNFPRKWWRTSPAKGEADASFPKARRAWRARFPGAEGQRQRLAGQQPLQERLSENATPVNRKRVLAWISTDKHSANAALAQEGYGTAESGSGRYLKGCTDKSIARSLFADGDRPGLCSARMAGYAKPLLMGVFWRWPRWRRPRGLTPMG